MRAQLVRTASFSRRGSKNSNARDDETDRDECSDSRSATPDTERAPNSPTFVHSPTDSESEPSTILSDHLYGWLKKRTSGGSWNKRYFFVDETRGTLGYSKAVKNKSSKPSAVLPIADITRVEKGDEPCEFKISCPPIHLTVAAASVKQRKMWVKQLEMRAELWRARQSAKIPVANVADLMRKAQQESKGGAAAASERSRPIARSPVTLSEPKMMSCIPDDLQIALPIKGTQGLPLDMPRPGMGAHSELVPRPAVPESSVSPPNASHTLLRTVREPSPGLHDPNRASPVIEDNDPIDLSAGESPAESVKASDYVAPAPSAAWIDEVHSPAVRADPVKETIELYSDDEEEDSQDVVRSANRAAKEERSRVSPPMRNLAPVPLASMISSDEDEEEDNSPIRPRVVRARPDAAHALLAPVPAPPVEPPSCDDLPASAADWDSESGEVGPIEEPIRSLEEDVDDSFPRVHTAEIIEQSPFTSEAEAPVMAAPGIVADSNFADDDWDDEESLEM